MYRIILLSSSILYIWLNICMLLKYRDNGISTSSSVQGDLKLVLLFTFHLPISLKPKYNFAHIFKSSLFYLHGLSKFILTNSPFKHYHLTLTCIYFVSFAYGYKLTKNQSLASPVHPLVNSTPSGIRLVTECQSFISILIL